MDASDVVALFGTSSRRSDIISQFETLQVSDKLAAPLQPQRVVPVPVPRLRLSAEGGELELEDGGAGDRCPSKGVRSRRAAEEVSTSQQGTNAVEASSAARRDLTPFEGHRSPAPPCACVYPQRGVS
jgi:hypothetical protein